MNKFFIVIITIILCIVVGCSSTPDGVYSEGDMEDILYDYYKAKAMAENLPSDVQYKAALYLQSVYKKHGTSEAEFDSSLVWYTSHPDKFMDIYKNLDKRLGNELKDYGGGNALMGNLPALNGDTTELWNAGRFYLLSNTLFSHRMNFYMKADSSFHEEDRFAWSFTVHLPGTGFGGGNMTAAICIRYNNDSIVGTTQNIYSSGPVTLMIDATPHLKIKAVYGFVYKSGGENSESSMPYSISLIDHLSLLRQHKQLLKMDSGDHSEDSARLSKDTIRKVDEDSAKSTASSSSIEALGTASKRNLLRQHHKLKIVK